MVTGENKKQFEKWYEKQTYPNTEVEDALLPLSPFNNLDIRHQIGVYLAYYDSLDTININVVDDEFFTMNINYCYQIETLFNREYLQYEDEGFKSRNEAYQKAFKQADLILNK
jgi:hypothetical protein